MRVAPTEMALPALELVWVPGWATAPACFESLRQALARALPHRPLRHRSVGFAGCREPADFPAAVRATLAAAGGDGAPQLVVAWSMGALAALLGLGLEPVSPPLGLVVLAGCARFTRSPAGEGAGGEPARPAAGTVPGTGARPGVAAASAGWHPAVLRQMVQGLARDREGTLARFYAQLGEEASPSGSPEPGGPGAVPCWPPGYSDRGPWLEAGLRFLAEADAGEAARQLRLPVLVVHGGTDRVIPAAAGEGLAHLLPAAAFRLIPGAGHAVHVTRPEAVASAVAAFLAALAATP